MAFIFCHALWGLPNTCVVFHATETRGKAYLRLSITVSFPQSLHKVSEWSVTHPKLEWQPWSCTAVGFPHPFPIKSAILAGKAQSFCFLSLFEFIASGSKTACFRSQSQSNNVAVLPTNLVKEGREQIQQEDRSFVLTPN